MYVFCFSFLFLFFFYSLLLLAAFFFFLLAFLGTYRSWAGWEKGVWVVIGDGYEDLGSIRVSGVGDFGWLRFGGEVWVLVAIGLCGFFCECDWQRRWVQLWMGLKLGWIRMGNGAD